MGMTAIAYDRYIMICFAADANRIASRFRSFRIALMVWAYASIFAILPSFGIGGFIMDGKLSSTLSKLVTSLVSLTLNFSGGRRKATVSCKLECKKVDFFSTKILLPNHINYTSKDSAV